MKGLSSQRPCLYSRVVHMWVCTCMCACLCGCVNSQTSAHAHACVCWCVNEAVWAPASDGPYLFIFAWDRISHWPGTSPQARLASKYPASASSLEAGVPGLYTVPKCFYKDSGDTNSAPHTCEVNALSADLSASTSKRVLSFLIYFFIAS